MNNNQFMIGYDYQVFSVQGRKIPLYAPINALHTIVVGGSNSGKSTAVLYWLYKMKKFDCELHIVDFKASHEFCGISNNFYEFEESYEGIKKYYENFLNTHEGNDKTKILLIDEISGLLTHYSMTKDGKQKADEIRNIMSSILMLGRSRGCFLWLSMQRYSASIFPSSSGSADNFQICVGLGRLTVDGRKGLFAGEHFEGEEDLLFGQGKGIVLIDGQPLKSIIIPKVSKKRLLELLQQR